MGAGATQETLDQFVSVSESGGNTVVSVGAQAVVTLQGVTSTTLQQLVDNHQIVV